MTTDRGVVGLSWLSAVSLLVGLLAMAFSLGGAAERAQCHAAIVGLRFEVLGAVATVDGRLSAHIAIPIHPGSASAEALQGIAERVDRLSQALDGHEQRRLAR